MRLYHGSDHIIQKPEFGTGKTYNDYGRGFYCTQVVEMAREWAASMEQDGFVNEYDLDSEGLTVLDLNGEEFNCLHWLGVLLENRIFDTSSALAYEAREFILSQYAVDYKSADIIKGYRADDSYFSFAQDFLNGTISYRQLANAMHLGRLGEQIVLKSERAFRQIRYVSYEIADHGFYYALRMQRDQKSRREYLDRERYRRQPDDIYILNILNGEVKSDDPRL